MPKPSNPARSRSFGFYCDSKFSTNSYIERDSAVLTALTYGLIALESGTYEGNDYFLGDVEMDWEPPMPIVPYG